MEGVLEGWVKNYRKIEEWKYYKRPCHSHLFQHIVRRANFKDGYNSNAQLVKRGEMDYTLRILANETGLTKKQVENILKDLKIGTEIGTVYTARNQKEFSILSVTNYEKYQGEDSLLEHSIGTAMGTAGGQQGDSRGTAGGHPKELKKDKNEKNGRSKKAQTIPTQLPKGLIYDFLPSSELEFYQFAFSTVTQKLQEDLLKRCGSESVLVKHLETFRIAVENGRTIENYGLSISNWLKKGLEWDKEKIDPEEKRKQSDEYFLQDGQITVEATTSFLEELWTKD